MNETKRRCVRAMLNSRAGNQSLMNFLDVEECDSSTIRARYGPQFMRNNCGGIGLTKRKVIDGNQATQ